MEKEVIYYAYGLCTMFYAMMAWIFRGRGHDRLSRLVVLLMMIICLELIKDLFFIPDEIAGGDWSWKMMTSVDMVAEPFYAFILIELCKPGTLTKRIMLLHETPFVLLPVLLFFTRLGILYDVLVAWSAIYGIYYAVWTLVEIPRYHQRLRERFSYDENINLKWMRIIMLSFFAILSLWVIDSLIVNLYLEVLYMIGSMVIWMFICYFLYKHESVVSELEEQPAKDDIAEASQMADDSIGAKIEKLFIVDKVYLNPKLKLSDVASMIGSNRTYVSKYFNREKSSSFYDYVNNLRIEHACRLLTTSSDKLDRISFESGFCSLATFYRVFSKVKHCSPIDYRNNNSNL